MQRSSISESNDVDGVQKQQSADQMMQVLKDMLTIKVLKYCLHCSDYIPEKEPLTWRFWKKRRYIVVVLAFFGFFNVYSLRVNLSVAIVAMTENRTVDYGNGTYGHV